MRLRIAYSRQGAFTGHSAQICLANSTPTPSLGKNVDGGVSRHLPRAIHSESILTSISVPTTESDVGLAGNVPTCIRSSSRQRMGNSKNSDKTVVRESGIS